MKLTSQNVTDVMKKCLAVEGDEGAICINMIAHSWYLASEKLVEHKQDIIDMLNDLPKEFHEDGGGGYSFLMACNDKDGTQWTGMHIIMEHLFCLGVGIKRVKFLLPRSIWPALPGGVPYLVVTKEDIPDEEMEKMLATNKVEKPDNTEEEDHDMIYSVGDEVRYTKTGQFGIVKDVDEENEKYTIVIEGTEYVVAEDELS